MWVHRRETGARRGWLHCGNDRGSERGLIEWQMEQGRTLQGELRVAVAAGNLPERKGRRIGTGIKVVGIQRWRRFTARSLRMPLGREPSLVFWREDFRSNQVVFRVDVFGLFCLFFAGTFLPRCFRRVLGLLSAAARGPEQQTGAKKYGETAA